MWSVCCWSSFRVTRVTLLGYLASTNMLEKIKPGDNLSHWQPWGLQIEHTGTLGLNLNQEKRRHLPRGIDHGDPPISSHCQQTESSQDTPLRPSHRYNIFAGQMEWSPPPDSLNRTLWPPEGGGFVTSFFMLKILEESFTIPDVRFLINF